jgi:DNA-binding response OmpR family regulator
MCPDNWQPRILVVDDDRDLCGLLVAVLTGAGYAASCANDGEAAWVEILRHSPQLVLSDITMPRLDGLGLARRLLARGSVVPIILMSAGDGGGAAALGIAFVRKPFDLDHLLARIAQVLEHADPSALCLRGRKEDHPIATDTPPAKGHSRWAGHVALTAGQQPIETALRESELRFQAVWEATSEALTFSDRDGIVVAVNPAYCALYGRPAEAQVGRSFAILFPEEERTAADAQYRTYRPLPGAPAASAQATTGPVMWRVRYAE